MSPQQAISAMESLEREFRALKWRTHCKARLANPGDTRSSEMIEPLDYFYEVTVDPIAKRHYVRAGGGGFQNGRSDASFVHEESFDGEAYRYLRRCTSGKRLHVPKAILRCLHLLGWHRSSTMLRIRRLVANLLVWPVVRITCRGRG